VIGVLADPGEHDAVREFFELFKTPWELCRSGRTYEVVLSTEGGRACGAPAKLVLIYSGARTPADEEARIPVAAQGTGIILSYAGARLPIYGRNVTFREAGIGLATEGHPQQTAAYRIRSGGRVVVRIGYDLFREVRGLLTEGQPLENAAIAALELHIALLRELITWSATPLVEIPPVPDGHRLIACLTHDVDHPSIRRHKWDRTSLGFLYRACVGSALNVCRGRASVGDLFTNWTAALRLPFIHLGLAKDFWDDLAGYRDIDPGAGSTFFVIPFKNCPGRTAHGSAPGLRAARYGARDIADGLRRLMSAGSEIGVHGIDAWLDSARGHEERTEIARITEAPDIGIRMHWLYRAHGSPAVLEKAGFAYDSTSGYNETVGYRAGTTQVFKPLDATRLLELPLHVMDTALFYPGHLNLAPREARDTVRRIIDNACRFGGIVTVNWHDRSIAPERLWGRVYKDVVDDLKAADAWFPTASQAVAWFRKRRSAVFQSVVWDSTAVRARVSLSEGKSLPGLRLRVYKVRTDRDGFELGAAAPTGYADIGLNESLDTWVRI
jgi:hypothetical protein